MNPLLHTLPQADPNTESAVLFDLIIIGSGPGGMSAAICAARADLKILIIEKAMPGGSLSTAFKISNVTGFPDGIMGPDMAKQMEGHMMRYPIQYTNAYVDYIQAQPDQQRCCVTTHINTRYYSKYVILATGLEPKRLDKPFEAQFRGRGISYFAACDGDTYKNKPIAVIGGGNCACYAAEYLSQFATPVYLIHRSESLTAVTLLKKRVMENPAIQIMWQTEVIDALGTDRLDSLRVQHNITGQSTWLDVTVAFVYSGRIPNQATRNFGVHCDEDGFIITDEYMQTSMPRVYAIGDIRAKDIRQVQTALSDGMIAAVTISKRLTYA